MLGKLPSFLILMFLILFISASAPNHEKIREQANSAYKEGNYKDAFELYSRLVFTEDNDPKLVGQDMKEGIRCLDRLKRTHETDAFRERALKLHQGNWRFLQAAAQSFISGRHYGYITAGKFNRGRAKGGGEYVTTYERDRVQALQLMQKAMALIGTETDQAEAGLFYRSFASQVLNRRQNKLAWKLQILSDLNDLPDYHKGYSYGAGSAAPVDEKGEVVLYHVPDSFDSAKNDGERWRWLNHKAQETDVTLKPRMAYEFAMFLKSQFGVHTLRSYSHYFYRSMEEDAEKSRFTLQTLKDEETIAKLATGVKRFTLAKGFQYVVLLKELGEGPKEKYGENALSALADIYQNRRQYEKAAKIWLESIERYGPGNRDWKKSKLDQIVKAWGRFEIPDAQAKGKGARIDYRFRNGTRVSFEAYEVKVEQVLQDIKAYLKTKPAKLSWRAIDLGNIGYRLISEEESKYRGERVASWDLELKPLKGHFDRKITVTTPLQKAGAYLIKARMKDGNSCSAVLWVHDTVIVKKQLQEGAWCYVGDAITGKPVKKANVEFFGYKRQKNQVQVQNFSEFTDDQGQVVLTTAMTGANYNWLIMARTEEGRLAYLGFTSVWSNPRYSPGNLNQNRCFIITDRPVYRPGDTVKYKGWLRKAEYGQEDISVYANTKGSLLIRNPKREKIQSQSFQTGQWGGFEGELVLENDATLGAYHIGVTSPSGMGGVSFRVEEYKKPEFEVKVEAPSEPVALGDVIEAKIQANYYFGAPVTNAEVKYKVTRTPKDLRWYPPFEWDWFYGPGYWWFAKDYYWYPGFSYWGCFRPIAWWVSGYGASPEVVLENEAKISADGTLIVKIDTSLAKEIHGNQDHNYEITAEVRDASRRTIVGKGFVLAARKPFKVYSWVDRGFYNQGDVIKASFKAMTPDQKPVQGKGELQLLKIEYEGEKRTPKETGVQTWKLDTNEAGSADLQIKASQPGQFRLSYKVTDKKGNTEEGGYVFCIHGQGFDSHRFRFNDIEVTADKGEYKPGEKAKLMIATDHPDSTVLLFEKPCNGVYLKPRLLSLKSKAVLEELEIKKADMPNIFVEVLTISKGKIFSESMELVVPPEKRVLKVEVSPSSKRYKPGERAKVKIRVTDSKGEPHSGDTAIAVYDKSVEYISGGSNVPEIREYFWKWRRRHYERQESSLYQAFGARLFQNPRMRDIGVFGDTLFFDDGGDWGVNSLEMSRSAPRKKSKGARMEMDGESLGRLRSLGYNGGDAPSAPGAAGPTTAGPKGPGVGGPPEKTVEPVVRKNFADTAFWAGSVTTDQDGMAEVEFDMPENLTSWKIRTWAMGHGTKVGQGDSEAVTAKNLLLRLQAPRFFVEKDEVVLSANIHNYLDQEKKIKAVLELDGACLKAMEESSQEVVIASMGEKRVDWRVKVLREGEAKVRMKALGDEESDAMEMGFPVYVHGMLKTLSFSNAIRPEKETGSLSFEVPKERRVNDSILEIRYSPSLACAMVDALPYLAEYPHGCTEQTLNRFVPAVITKKVLLDMGLDLKKIQEKRTNLNAQEIGEDQDRAKQWKRWKRNPVFDEKTLDDMVKTGLSKLTSMQNSDGGWGWFYGYGERSYPHTTAVVVHGLQAARDSDLAIVPGVLENGIKWLKIYQQKEVHKLKNAATETDPYKRRASNLDAFVYMVLGDEKHFDAAMGEFLYRDRTKLSLYANAMIGIAYFNQQDAEKVQMIVKNIEQFLVTDEENQTAYLDLPTQYWWYWYGSDNEAMAYYLKLLSRVAPKSEKAAGVAKYLINNRKNATYWRSTRDTAFCIEALADFIRASGEDKPDMTVTILVDNKKHKEVTINGENLFSFDNALIIKGDAIESGTHTVKIVKKGKGPLYFNAYLTYFSLEDFITRAGLEVKVNRKIYKLVPEDKKADAVGARGQAVKEKVEKFKRIELENLATLKSGDMVEIELEIDSKNDYEYLIFEDMKAAGFEPVDVRSGYLRGGMRAYMELRDERVCFFVKRLMRGKHSVSYRMRAEIPGLFSALPAKAHAMYAPELKANSDEIKLSIED